MRVAVTGATGFLGRYIVRHLAAAGHEMRCWYRPGSDRSGLESEAAAIEWLPGLLGDAAAARELVNGADAVVHAAVQWQGPRNRGGRSHGASDVFLGVNLTGSLELFQAAFATVSRFVFISTCAVHEEEANEGLRPHIGWTQISDCIHVDRGMSPMHWVCFPTAAGRCVHPTPARRVLQRDQAIPSLPKDRWFLL